MLLRERYERRFDMFWRLWYFPATTPVDEATRFLRMKGVAVDGYIRHVEVGMEFAYPVTSAKIGEELRIEQFGWYPPQRGRIKNK